ncbi:MAG: TatD family hydrolase, partial [Clostridia bacterium]|nr:TatD family hydrolase [Clostridia bacterium]
MINNIFDSHAHYDDEKFDGDRREIIEKIFSSGVCAVINCGCDVDSSMKSIRLCDEYEKFFAAVGIHPHSAEEEMDRLSEVFGMINKDKVVAIGEIGLDYHYDFSDRDIQK